MPKWFLNTLEITGGWLPGLHLEFPQGLTCIIGPRGSGKTTLAEALRYGIVGPSGASNTGLMQATLGSSTLMLTVGSPGADGGYTIRRAYKQPASVMSGTGKPLDVDLDRGSFLSLDAFNSHEIEAIANEKLGAKRRGLLDELRGEELREILLTIKDARRALEANADSITATRKLIGDLTEQIEELHDARAKLAALPPAPTGAGSGDLLLLAQQQQASEAELGELDAMRTSLNRFGGELQQWVKQQRAKLPKTAARERSPNQAQIAASAAAIETFADFAEARAGEIKVEAEKAAEKITALRGEIETGIRQRAAEALKLQQTNQAVSQAIAERSAAEEKVRQLDTLEKRRTAEEANLLDLFDERRGLKRDYLLKREQISKLRHSVAEELQQRIGAAVRLTVRSNADNLAYRELLKQSLTGAGVRNHDEILDALMGLRPEQLAQIIQDSEAEELEELTSLGKERSGKILKAFAEKLDPLALEIIDIDDSILIELNVATAAQPHFKDAAELSQGQKCTALLPLLLSRRDVPLIIDQPEDNLDNHFIYETVVDAVRRLKAERQLIFITHNANIPVLGEADLVVVMNSDGKRGFVEKAGTLDDCREEIIDLLEGGHKAFQERTRRYAVRA